MTDKELLEMAAKAAGYTMHGEGRTDGSFIVLTNDDGAYIWNPLTDDGDAFRLSVKLEMCVSAPFCYSAQAKCADVRCRVTVQESDGDIYAATRRVIVRAAAEIGKAMTAKEISLQTAD